MTVYELHGCVKEAQIHDGFGQVGSGAVKVLSCGLYERWNAVQLEQHEAHQKTECSKDDLVMYRKLISYSKVSR